MVKGGEEKMNKIGILILMVVLVTIGSIYTVSSNSDEINFCVWGLSCGEDIDEDIWEDVVFYPSDIITIVPRNDFSDYNFTNEGSTSYSYFFDSLEEVINVSRSNYQELITVVSAGDSFDEVYHLNVKIFMENYTLDIDRSSPTGEYIQNIGEIVLNGHQGDCDDYALFLYLVAKEMGEEVRYATGFREGGGGHAWIQIKVDGEWKDYGSTSDEICDDCISGKYYIRLSYYEEEEDGQ